MRYARLYWRLAALAFFSTTPLASFLGSSPLLSQEGTFACPQHVGRARPYWPGTGGLTLAAGRVPLRIHRWIRRPLPASPVYILFFESIAIMCARMNSPEFR